MSLGTNPSPPNPHITGRAAAVKKQQQWLSCPQNHHQSAPDCTHQPQSTPPRPLSFPTPGKTVPHHPLGDGHQVTVPHHPLGDRTTTVHTHLQAQKLQHKTKEFSIRYVQRAANVRRPPP